MVVYYDSIDMNKIKIEHKTHQPLVDAVYSPSPSFPMGTCAPAPPVALVDTDDDFDAVATAMLLTLLDERDANSRGAVINFMVDDGIMYLTIDIDLCINNYLLYSISRQQVVFLALGGEETNKKKALTNRHWLLNDVLVPT